MKVAVASAIASIVIFGCVCKSQSFLSRSSAYPLPLIIPDIKADGQEGALHFFKESSHGHFSSSDAIKGQRSLSSDTHELTFVVHQRKIDELERIFRDISDPSSSNYGNHLTKEGIIDLTSNQLAHQEVADYLELVGATVLANEVSSGLITAHGPVSLWERMLNTDFYSYSLRQGEGNHQDVKNNGHLDRQYIRTEEYSVPSCLHRTCFLFWTRG